MLLVIAASCLMLHWQLPALLLLLPRKVVEVLLLLVALHT
jgi:hypothetical protein